MSEAVAVDTQVRQAPTEAACLRVIASVQCLDGGSVLAGQKGRQGGVLVAVGDRVQLPVDAQLVVHH